jgi:hypothetical protein
VHRDRETAFANLKTRILLENRIHSQAVASLLLTEQRRHVEVTADYDIRIVIWLAEIPIQVVKYRPQFTGGLLRVAIRERQMYGDQGKVEVIHSELGDLRRMNRTRWICHDLA